VPISGEGQVGGVKAEIEAQNLGRFGGRIEKAAGRIRAPVAQGGVTLAQGGFLVEAPMSALVVPLFFYI